MPIVMTSVGTLQAVNTMAAPTLVASYGGGSTAWALGGVDTAVYGTIYATQPNVRTVVDFLSRNIAQLGIHVFRRVSDTDRVRLADHALVDWLEHPNPATTRYRLIETLVQDVAIYWNAYWLKIRLGDRIGLARLPPAQVTVLGGLTPSRIRWTTSAGEVYDFPPSEVVQLSGYDPENPLTGLSPLETLRRVLAEDVAAMAHRESFWLNAARIEGVIERPLAAKPWSPDQIDSFRSQWQARFTGAAGVGSVPVLQDGMVFKPNAFSPRQAEYVAARKLTREEVAAAYHVPLPMVGILDHATYSNVREQHKQLYQDTLGPWLVWLAEEFERQLLIECDDRDGVYVEFNIAEKLTGSFEEQAGALQTLVGRPVMTVNEGRARLNLPADDDPASDEVAAPLNMATPARAESPQAVDVAPVIERAWQRQSAVLGKLPSDRRAENFDADRWQHELAADLLPHYRAAGYDERRAQRHAAQLAYIVTTDTRTLLATGAAAFPPHREASTYVD